MFKGNRYKLISSICIRGLIIVVMICSISACGDNSTITEYTLLKSTTTQEWYPGNPTTYHVGENSVTSETAGSLGKYDNCIILSVRNWECTYSDGSGSFGFRNGEFWRYPQWKGFKAVSRLEYNRVRCESAYSSEGKFWGTVRCVLMWE